MESSSERLFNYLPLRITRPVLGSSGGAYSLNLSSVFFYVSVFTFLIQVDMAIQCVENLTLFICSLCDFFHSLNYLTFVTEQNVTTSHFISVSCCSIF